jgi:hypothetical protein
MPPSKAWWIDGKATLTTTASRVTTKNPITAASSVNRDCPLTGDVRSSFSA